MWRLSLLFLKKWFLLRKYKIFRKMFPFLLKKIIFFDKLEKSGFCYDFSIILNKFAWHHKISYRQHVGKTILLLFILFILLLLNLSICFDLNGLFISEVKLKCVLFFFVYLRIFDFDFYGWSAATVV